MFSYLFFSSLEQQKSPWDKGFSGKEKTTDLVSKSVVLFGKDRRNWYKNVRDQKRSKRPFIISFDRWEFVYSNQKEHFYNFCFVIPRKKRKTGTLLTISYIKNVAINEINTINKNCPATPTGNFKAKKPTTTRIGIWRM